MHASIKKCTACAHGAMMLMHQDSGPYIKTQTRSYRVLKPETPRIIILYYTSVVKYDTCFFVKNILPCIDEFFLC